MWSRAVGMQFLNHICQGDGWDTRVTTCNRFKCVEYGTICLMHCMQNSNMQNIWHLFNILCKTALTFYTNHQGLKPCTFLSIQMLVIFFSYKDKISLPFCSSSNQHLIHHESLCLFTITSPTAAKSNLWGVVISDRQAYRYSWYCWPPWHACRLGKKWKSMSQTNIQESNTDR